MTQRSPVRASSNGTTTTTTTAGAGDPSTGPSAVPEDELQRLLSQLRVKLTEGNGETLYHLGSGDGSPACRTDQEFADGVALLSRAADLLGAEQVQLRSTTGPEGTSAEFLIRRRAEIDDFHEVRVAVVGNVDAGKSTLLGVLTHGDLDNGRGLARQKLFRHKHELDSGRTSSIGNDILGFDSRGNIVNQPDPHGGHLDWVSICEKATKVLTFIDLAGHEKYLKTTIFGMTGHAPDFTMLMIGANAGVVGMTKEHLGLALALSVPVFVVITKIDMCPANVLQNTIKLLHKVLKSPGCRKIPVMVQNEEDVVLAASNFATERLCPIFQVSNVHGTNLPLLKSFMNLLMPRGTGFHDHEPAEFQIDDHYSVPGVGTVVSGLTLKGIIRLNDVLCLGPDSLGHFVNVAIRSIHRKRMPVREVRSGQTASFSLKKIKRSDIRKGMVMLSPVLKPLACWEFEGEILVLHHPTTISPRYQAMVHCGSVRQTASILSMSVDYLRTGDKAKVHFRFMKNPEYIRAGQKMVFREGRTKAIGTVTAALPGVPPSVGNKIVKKDVRERKTGGSAGQQSHEDGDTTSGTGEREPRRRGGHHRFERRHKLFNDAGIGAGITTNTVNGRTSDAGVTSGPSAESSATGRLHP